MTFRRALSYAAAVSAAALLIAAPGADAKEVKTVTQTPVLFAHATREGNPGNNCYALAYVRFGAVPATTTSATAAVSSPSLGSPSFTRPAPAFDDRVQLYAASSGGPESFFTAPAGTHQVLLGDASYQAGFGPNGAPADCADLEQNLRRLFPPTATLTITYTAPDGPAAPSAACTSAKSSYKAQDKLVKRYTKQLKKAKKASSRKRLKARLKTAKSRRSAAQKRVTKNC